MALGAAKDVENGARPTREKKDGAGGQAVAEAGVDGKKDGVARQPNRRGAKENRVVEDSGRRRRTEKKKRNTVL